MKALLEKKNSLMTQAEELLQNCEDKTEREVAVPKVVE